MRSRNRAQEEYTDWKKQRRRETARILLTAGGLLAVLAVGLVFAMGGAIDSWLTNSSRTAETEPYKITGTVAEKGRDEDGQLYVVLEYDRPGQKLRSKLACDQEVYDDVTEGEQKTFLCQFDRENGWEQILRIGTGEE